MGGEAHPQIGGIGADGHARQELPGVSEAYNDQSAGTPQIALWGHALDMTYVPGGIVGTPLTDHHQPQVAFCILTMRGQRLHAQQ